MVAVAWMFVCLIVIGGCCVDDAQGGCENDGDSYTDYCKWNGQVTAGSNGPDGTLLCYDWTRNFSTTRDLLLRLNVKLGAGLSLQIIKYSNTATRDLVGELKGCEATQTLDIAVANCSGFALNVVGKVCTSNASQSKAVMHFFSTPNVSDSNSESCHPSPCANVPCLELEIQDTMGYRCYCKDWFQRSCFEAPLFSNEDKQYCKCGDEKQFIGEICNLNGPTISTIQTQSIAPSLSKTAVVSNQSSEASSSSSAVGIGAGVAGGVVIIVLLLVLLIILYYRSQSKKSESRERSPEEESLPRSQFSWNADYRTACRNPADEQRPAPCVIADTNNRSDQNGTSDGAYSYPFVVGDTSRTSNTYDHPSPVLKSTHEEPYWQPEQTVEKLYAQFEGKRFRMLHRSDVKLETEIGSGEFGTVAKGSWKSSSGLEVVAVKTLNSESSQDRVRFLREAAIMGQFKHKNVVALKGVILQGEPLMIVLEFMANGDLREHLQSVREGRRCHVDGYAKTLLRMSREIASGMTYLSKKGFIHRDLAIRNVLLDSNLTCKIGDFGLARDLTDSNYYMTRGGRLPIRWTAPEAIAFRKYSTASDVWGYGIVLYEIWTIGERPYGFTWSNNFVMECLQKGYRLPPPPGCPLPMYQLMINCWHPDHHERPTFTDIVVLLGNDDGELLVNPPGTEPVRGKLGDPIDSVLELYMNLQTTYQTKNTE